MTASAARLDAPGRGGDPHEVKPVTPTPIKLCAIGTVAGHARSGADRAVVDQDAGMREPSALPPPPPGGRFRVESTLTRSEFVWSHRAIVQAVSRQPNWVMPIVFVASIVGGLVLRRTDDSWFPIGLIALGSFGLLLGLMLVVVPHITWRLISDDRRIQELEVDPTGIASGTDDLWVSVPWEAIRHVVHGPDALAIIGERRKHGIIVAHRSLDAAQRALLEQLLDQRASNARFSELN